MVILGDNYKFNQLDINHLKKGYKPIFIPYNHTITTQSVVDNLQKHLPKSEQKVVVLNTKNLNSEVVNYLKQITNKGYKVITIEKFLEKYPQKSYIDTNSQVHIKPYTKLQYIQKRFVDFAISIPLAILTLPFMAYSAYRIKKESPNGPVIYAQKRVGLNNQEFVCYKFRSMVPDAENGKPQFASKDDPRVFKWGEFMRKTRIDELPQLLNVLKGEMHLIGPRPERKYWVEQFEKEIPNYNKRHNVAPGITGWAQVNYPYGENLEDAKQKLMYDLYYIKHWSLWLEIKTIFKTVAVVLGKKGI